MFALFNFNTNPIKPSANMTHTNTQKKRHQKTPYEALSGDKNAKKSEKNEENTKSKQNSQTASESRDPSRDVKTSPNTNSNNSNKSQEDTTSALTINEIDIPDADQAIINDWRTIELTQRHTLSLSMPVTAKEKTFWKKRNT